MAARLKRALRSGEDGFTIIEVLVASFILVLGALAVFMTFTTAIRNVQRGKEMQQGVSVAQREMERLRIQPYTTLAMQVNPGPPARVTEANPLSRVVGGQFDADRGTDTKLLSFSPLPPGSPTGSGVVAETQGVSSPDGTKVTVFRFVLCELEEQNACRAKRLVVDVLPSAADNEHDYQHSYYELQSTVVNPETVVQ